MFKPVRSKLGSKAMTQVMYEMDVKVQSLCLGEETTPPPLIASESRLAKIDVNAFLGRSEIELGPICSGDSSAEMRTRLISGETGEGISDSVAESTRIDAIRRVVTAVGLHIIAVSIITHWLQATGLVSNRIVLMAGLLLAAVCSYLLCKYGNKFSRFFTVLGFASYTAGLALSFVLLSSLASATAVSHLLIQLLVATVGLCYYAWTTKYEEWSSCEEKVFGAVPCILATLVLWLVMSHEVLPLAVTMLVTLAWSTIQSECSKDITIPAKTLAELLADVLFLNLSTLDMLKFLAAHRMRRLFEKLDIV